MIPKHLTEGRIVRLGEFGSFMLTLSSEGVETKEAFRKDKIRNTKLRFRPGKLIKSMIKNTDYQEE